MAFYCMMKAMGAQINSEVSSSKGRADAVLMAGKHVYVIEFKINKTADNALRQIRSKGYCEQYELWKNTYDVHLVGISFSTESRNIAKWKEIVL